MGIVIYLSSQEGNRKIKRNIHSILVCDPCVCTLYCVVLPSRTGVPYSNGIFTSRTDEGE